MKPFVCPVCHGRGSMPSKFYNPPLIGVVPLSGSAAGEPHEQCRSCFGRGIVFVPEPEQQPVVMPDSANQLKTTISTGTVTYKGPYQWSKTLWVT